MKLAEAFRLARSIKAAGPRRFTNHMVPHVVRPAQIIWNKALGGVFLLLAVVFLVSAIRYTTSSPANPVGFAFALFICIVMTSFGVTSFLKARRLNRL